MEHLTHTMMLFSAEAASSLIKAIGEGMILAVAVHLCLRLLPGIKSTARFTIWLAVFFVVLPLHILPSVKGDLGSAIPGVSAFHVDSRWSILIVCLWGVASVTRAIRLIRSAIELQRIAVAAIPISPAPSLDGILSKSGGRSAKLCSSKDVDRPSVAGFFRPRILLPTAMLEKLSEQELEQILLHEMEHLHRRDDWTNLIQKIALILFPLNPVLSWVERRLCIERELACDDCVLNLTMARKAYATCLTNLAEHSMLRRSASLALGAWEKQSELARRVHRILRKPEEKMGRTTTNVISGALMASLVGGAFMLAHSPELVSFSPPTTITVSSGAPVAASLTPIRQSRGFSPTLVKAVMPEPRQEANSHPPRARRPEPVKTIHHRPPVQQQQEWVVLTGWQTSTSPVTRRPVLAISETSESSYAAVSVGDGWLIFQL
jgi:hypothetical protein